MDIPLGGVLFWVVLFFLCKDLDNPWKWIVVGFIVRDGWLWILVSLSFFFRWVGRVVREGGAALGVDVMVVSCFVIFRVASFGGENGS